MIKVRISDQMMFAADGIAIAVIREDADRYMLRFGEDHERWEHLPDLAVVTQPTMTLNNDVARALLDALLRYYQGASDMHTVRADLLHERGRVDKLTDAVIGLASGRQTAELRRSER